MNQENLQQTTKDPQKVMFAVTKSNWGGAQRYVFDLATHLPRAQYEPLVACGPAQGARENGPLVQRLVQAGVRTIVIPEFTRDVSVSDFRAFGALYRLLTQEKPTVLHLNSSKVGALGSLAGRLTGVPHIVFTVHGWGFRENVRVLSKAFRWTASMLTIVFSHRVICVSENDRLSIPSVLRRKAVTIHNAITDEPLSLSREHARQKLILFGASRDRLRDTWIGVIAEHTANKNLTVAIRAFATAWSKNNSLYLILIGDGEERFMLSNLARELHIAHAVFFAGFVPQAHHYMSAFDALLLTSRKEGLPYAILEAQAAGVPVIASRTGGIPEILRDTVNGFLCPVGDVECFAQALNSFAHLPAPAPHSTDTFETMLNATIAQY